MRFLADIGNSRLKLVGVDSGGQIVEQVSVATEQPETWRPAIEQLGGLSADAAWGISSVRPESASILAHILEEANLRSVRWFRRAADVPIRHHLDNLETAGADRALAVLGCISSFGLRDGALVVMCGTALTVERITRCNTWQGGAIAPGWGPLASALHTRAAQLPLIEPPAVGQNPVPFGLNTREALTLGLRGMIVGGCRELIRGLRQGLPSAAPIFWTGGDAAWLAPAVEGEAAQIVPDLVFRGLVHSLGWGADCETRI